MEGYFSLSVAEIYLNGWTNWRMNQTPASSPVSSRTLFRTSSSRYVAFTQIGCPASPAIQEFPTPSRLVMWMCRDVWFWFGSSSATRNRELPRTSAMDASGRQTGQRMRAPRIQPS